MYIVDDFYYKINYKSSSKNHKQINWSLGRQFEIWDQNVF